MSKKLTTDDIIKAQVFQVDIFTILDRRIGNARKWLIELEMSETATEQKVEFLVMVANGRQSFEDSEFYCRAIMAEWITDEFNEGFTASMPMLRKRLMAYLDRTFPSTKQ